VNILNSKNFSNEQWKEFWRTIKEGNIWKGEIRNKRKNGNYYWIYATVIPLFDINKKVEQFLTIRFDISEDKIEKDSLIREVIEAQEIERERFAMEIHDGLGQVLLAAKMNLNSLHESNNNLAVEDNKILENTIHLLTDAVGEARNISHGLMSRVLSRFGLAYAIAEIVNNINNTSNLVFTFYHNINEVRLNEEVEMGIYRTLQELIKNIIKHSKATKAKLEITQNGKELDIVIIDNGIGISKTEKVNTQSNGIGLRNIRSRIEYLGGIFEIDNQLKNGTKINIKLYL